MSRELVGRPRNLVRDPSLDNATAGTGPPAEAVATLAQRRRSEHNDTHSGSYVARTQQPGTQGQLQRQPEHGPVYDAGCNALLGLECQLSVAARSSVVGAKLDRIRQFSSTGTLLGSDTSDAQTITSASWPAGNNGMWNFYSADYIVKPGGGSLDLNVIGQNLGTGGSYDVDDVELTCDTNPTN